LSRPADGFVREFVGLDRWMRRLELLSASGVPEVERALARLREGVRS